MTNLNCRRELKDCYTVDEVIESLERNLDVRISFNDGRGWSLYTRDDKFTKGYPKFGAWRNYSGGGVRGGIEHSAESNPHLPFNMKASKLFAYALNRIEQIINEGYENEEEWDKPTGVLL